MNASLSRIWTVCARELRGYAATPQAYVFIVVFLLLSGFFMFAPDFGNFLRTNEAGLAGSFFSFQPWLYLVLAPAMAMRLWAEERRAGTLELLLSMPVSVPEAVLGKFLAAWLVMLAAIALTFPAVATVNYLGAPDNGAIATGYLGSALLAGGYLAIGCFTSALTRNQVVSFVLSVVICLFILLAGYPSISDACPAWAPSWIPELLGDLSVPRHFDALRKGVVDFRDVAYFVSLAALGLFSAAVALDSERRAWD